MPRSLIPPTGSYHYFLMKTEKQKLYYSYLLSDHWLSFRTTKIESVGSACEVCKKRGTVHVHHINYRNWYDCELGDLMVLCARCHRRFHRVIKKYKIRSNQCSHRWTRMLADRFTSREFGCRAGASMAKHFMAIWYNSDSKTTVEIHRAFQQVNWTDPVTGKPVKDWRKFEDAFFTRLDRSMKEYGIEI